MRLRINGGDVDVPPAWRDESLLFLLREHLGLVGAKYGCGAGMCGACTVHLDGAPLRACLMPVSGVGRRTVTTIEGLGNERELHPVQQAWLDERVPQCGYCQSGQIMAAVALLRERPSPTPTEIDDALDGHLCRCGTHERVRAAIGRAAAASPRRR